MAIPPDSDPLAPSDALRELEGLGHAVRRWPEDPSNVTTSFGIDVVPSPHDGTFLLAGVAASADRPDREREQFRAAVLAVVAIHACYHGKL